MLRRFVKSWSPYVGKANDFKCGFFCLSLKTDMETVFAILATDVLRKDSCFPAQDPITWEQKTKLHRNINSSLPNCCWCKLQPRINTICPTFAHVWILELFPMEVNICKGWKCNGCSGDIIPIREVLWSRGSELIPHKGTHYPALTSQLFSIFSRKRKFKRRNVKRSPFSLVW